MFQPNSSSSGSGSGVGNKSYFTTIDIANASLANISTFHDATAYTDGTGGSPSVTDAINSTTPLSDANDLKFSKPASDCSGDGLTLLSDTIESCDKGRRLNVEFEWDGTDANYTSKDLKLYAYDVTNSAIITVIPVAGALYDSNNVASLPNLKTKVLCFITPASTCTSIRVSAYLLSDSATAAAWNCYLARPTLSPDAPVPSAIITPPIAYTPTFTGFGTVSGVNFVSWRSGAYLYVEGTFTAGTNTATEARISLGYGGADSNVTTASDYPTLQLVGHVESGTRSTTYFGGGGVLAEASKTYMTFSREKSTASVVLAKTNGNDWDSSQTFSVSAKFRISGWTASAALSTTDVGLLGSKVYGAGNGGTALTGGTTNADFTEVSDNQNEWSGTVYTANKAKSVLIQGSMATSGNVSVGIYAYVNGSISKLLGKFSSAGRAPFGGLISLSKGDTLSIRVDSGVTLSNTASDHWISIQEIPDFTIFSTYLDTADVELYLDSGNGHGSTNTKIRRFTTTEKNTLGSYATYADSSTAGMSVTVNVPGVYQIFYQDVRAAGATNFGISLNSSVLTTSITGVSYADGSRGYTTAETTHPSSITRVMRLSAGDVIRAHDDGTPDSTSISSQFHFMRVGP